MLPGARLPVDGEVLSGTLYTLKDGAQTLPAQVLPGARLPVDGEVLSGTL